MTTPVKISNIVNQYQMILDTMAIKCILNGCSARYAAVCCNCGICISHVSLVCTARRARQVHTRIWRKFHLRFRLQLCTPYGGQCTDRQLLTVGLRLTPIAIQGRRDSHGRGCFCTLGPDARGAEARDVAQKAIEAAVTEGKPRAVAVPRAEADVVAVRTPSAQALAFSQRIAPPRQQVC